MLLFPVVFVGIAVLSCNAPQPEAGGDNNAVRQTTAATSTMNTKIADTVGRVLDEPFDTAGLALFRTGKDAEFRGDDSPIPKELRSSFAGLKYYPAAPHLVFRVRLRRLARPEEVGIAATKGDVRTMLRYGTFSFPINGKNYTLTAYKSADDPGMLFVPFKDATNGSDTYEVGRYLDLEEQDGDAPYVLDFNVAYNPYCAYSDTYTCPMVPRENVLRVEIQAGEKLPSLAGH